MNKKSPAEAGLFFLDLSAIICVRRNIPANPGNFRTALRTICHFKVLQVHLNILWPQKA